MIDRSRQPRLLAILDLPTCAANGADPEDLAPRLLAAGANVLVRGHTVPTRALVRAVSVAVAAERSAGAQVLVSGRVDIARDCGADGVHLRSDGVVGAARAVLPGRWVSVSVHDEASLAAASGADHVTLSPVFPTPSKPGYGPALGVEAFAALCARTEIPVFALGGVTVDRIPALAGAGAWGVAVMGAICRPDGEAHVRRFLCALDAVYRPHG